MKPNVRIYFGLLYEWIVDSDSTPYVLVKVGSDEVMVPPEHVQDGQIILNVSPNAVRDLQVTEQALCFDGPIWWSIF